MAAVFFEGASELATLTNTFTVAGTPTDPSTVSLIITDPTGVATTYTYGAAQITKTGTGVYTKDIPCTIAGTWSYEWVGTAAASDVAAGTWEVLETDLGKLYCTVEMLKSSFKDARDTDDLEYHAACFTASRSLEQYCQRTFYRSTETRTLIPTDQYCLKLPAFYDLVSVTTLKTDSSGDGTFETTWSAGDYQLITSDGTPNINAGPEPKPYTGIMAIGSQIYPVIISTPAARRDRVEIAGVWGWPTVPWAIKQAATIVAAETFKLKDAPGMVAAGYEDFDVSMLDAAARRRFARFANPYRRSIPGFA
jgi:hypothetical protein